MIEERFLKKYKVALGLILVPQFINVVFTLHCYFLRSFSEFMGALIGTVLGLFFFLIWFIIVKKISLSNVLVLFAYSLGAFPVKLILFAVFVFGGFYFFAMDRYYFVFTFLFSVIISLVIEVAFILAINKSNIEYNKE